jgi:hypothetical protein
MEGRRRTLFNTRVVAGKRHYFFDVKENQRGERYLTITESQPDRRRSFRPPAHHDLSGAP